MRKHNRILRILRYLAGLSQQQLASQLKVDQSIVSRIESGMLKCCGELKQQWIKGCAGKTLTETLQSLQVEIDFLKFA